MSVSTFFDFSEIKTYLFRNPCRRRVHDPHEADRSFGGSGFEDRTDRRI